MFARDVEMFIEHCENKGLATKTIGSYEQTLRLLMLWLDEQGIKQTEKSPILLFLAAPPRPFE